MEKIDIYSNQTVKRKIRKFKINNLNKYFKIFKSIFSNNIIFLGLDSVETHCYGIFINIFS